MKRLNDCLLFINSDFELLYTVLWTSKQNASRKKHKTRERMKNYDMRQFDHFVLLAV